MIDPALLDWLEEHGSAYAEDAMAELIRLDGEVRMLRATLTKIRDKAVSKKFKIAIDEVLYPSNRNSS